MSKKIFFTPGPTQLFHSVPFHIQNALKADLASISHRSKDFEHIMSDLQKGLRSLLELPEDYHIFITSSATEVWERILQNLVIRKSHHFVNGAFSKRFYEFATSYGMNSTTTYAFSGDEFQDWTVPSDAELIALTMNETSIGYMMDQNRIDFIRKEYPDALIALDVVSITPSVKIDFQKVDTAYFSVQKCFGLPAGMGIWIINDRCIQKYQEKKESGEIVGAFRSVDELLSKIRKNQTPETPNVLNMYLLAKVIQDMQDRGIDTIRNETTYKSTLLYQMFNELDIFHPFIKQKQNQSKTVCVAECINDPSEVIEDLKKKGLIIGSGYGKYKGHHIRIANFPTHSKEQIEMLVDCIHSVAK
jgi:phosphoserine aminotransferase